MNWKKIIRYFLLAFVLLILFSVFWLNRGIKLMYGGLTQQVDYEQFTTTAMPLLLQNVQVLAPEGEHFIAGQTVSIVDGTITAIDSMAPKLPGAQVIDGTGQYLIPGLIDSHVHLFKSPNDLLLYVANGVTGIREMIGEKDHLKWRKQIKNGRIGPDMYIASPRMGSFGFWEGLFMSWAQGFVNITDAQDAQKTVKRLFKQGYDAVKIYSHLNKESYFAVNRTADSLGMKVVGHVPFHVQLTDIWNAQQCEIAHLEEVMNAFNREFDYFNSKNSDEFLAYVEKRSREIVDDLLENEIVVTTTLWLVESFVRQKFELKKVLREVALEYENPGISEGISTASRAIAWLPELNRYRLPPNLTEGEKASSKKYWETYGKGCQIIAKILADNGVQLLAGTDANLPPTVPGFSLHNELESLAQAGLAPAEVLRSATSAPAAWMQQKAGKIAPGYQANLVLLNENPLDKIGNTQSIQTVILHGHLLDRPQLDQILASVKAANDASRAIDISEFLQ